MARRTNALRETVPGARQDRLEARISKEQKALLLQAASLTGRSLTDFVVQSAQEAAMRTIQENEIIRLNASESRAFAEALLNPREPSPRLRAAAKRYAEQFGG